MVWWLVVARNNVLNTNDKQKMYRWIIDGKGESEREEW